MKSLAIGLWMLATLSPTAVLAQAYVPIEQRLDAEQLRRVGLSEAQLRTLNTLLRDAEAKAAAAPAAAVAEHAPEAGAVPDSASSLGGAPIRSRAKGVVSGWQPGSLFELENGQQWKVLKGSMTLHEPLQSPEIVVVPGLAGRWFLQVDPDLPKARVYRVD